MKIIRLVTMLLFVLGLLCGCTQSKITIDKQGRRTRIGKDGKKRILHCRYEAPTGSKIKKRVCYWEEDLNKRRDLDQIELQRLKSMGMGSQAN